MDEMLISTENERENPILHPRFTPIFNALISFRNIAFIIKQTSALHSQETQRNLKSAKMRS